MKQTLPARVQSFIARINGGESLCKSFRFLSSGETEVIFISEPSGKRAPPKSAKSAIASGLLAPAGDGLFAPEFSQTYIVIAGPGAAHAEDVK